MRLLSIFLGILLIFGCSTPSELIIEGKLNQAFNKATKQIKRGKDIPSNTDALKIASEKISTITIQYAKQYEQSNRLKDWTYAQKVYDKALKNIHNANQLIEGQLQSSYDKLCDKKIDLDFKITNHFYQKGEEMLAAHYEQLSKQFARDAYSNYKECLSFGGDRFFQDINEKIEESILQGTTYFISYNFQPTSRLFFQPQNQESIESPDCEISADFGGIRFSENSRSCTNHYSETIKVGTRTEVDTSGKTQYYPIYKDVHGSVTTTTVTVQASATTYVNVRNATGECFKRSDFFNNSVEDSYEIVSFCGDRRAIPSCYAIKNDSYKVNKWDLERRLNSEIDFDLFAW